MGQKVNPIGYRTGVFLGWKSRWYASKKEFGELLVEDQKIRRFIKTRTATKDNRDVKMYPMISKIEIERTRDEVKVILYSGRARDLSRNNNKMIDDLQVDLQNLIGRRISIVVEEVATPIPFEGMVHQTRACGCRIGTLGRLVQHLLGYGDALGVQLLYRRVAGGQVHEQEGEKADGHKDTRQMEQAFGYVFSHGITT